MFPTLDALPAEDCLVAVLVLAPPGTPACEAALDCIARQTLPPAEIIFAAPDVEGCGDLVPASLSASATVRWVIVPHTDIMGSRLALLCDEARSPLVAVLDTHDRWGPDYLRAAQDRFHEADADTLAAIAVPTSGTEVALSSRAEVQLEDALQGIGDTAHAFVYRREALERVGGWDPNLGQAAAWDLQLRLLIEWRIGLLAGDAAWRDGPRGGMQPDDRAAIRSRMLRRTLRRSPELIGLLMLRAQEPATPLHPVADGAGAAARDRRGVWAARPA
ncbi:MAG: glycosyltransferase family 2 protein [Roseomonas sp.]|nr:glycosyltransferase family 2 protein [Roseomonas sp.]